jgi:hypothetical protein
MPAAKKTLDSKVVSQKATGSKPKSVTSKKVDKKKPVKKVSPAKNTNKKPALATQRLRKNSSTKKTAPTVKLPNNVPLRSIEKAEVLRSELSLYWQKSMHRIAVVSGFCFLLVGSALASASVFDITPNVKHGALVATAVNEPVLTELTLLSTVPDQLSVETRVLFSLTNVHPESVEYFLVNSDTQKVFENGKPSRQLDDKYSVLISPEYIPAGHYKLRIQYIPKSTDVTSTLSKKAEVIAYFAVPEKEEPITDTTLVTQEPVESNVVETITELGPLEPVVDTTVNSAESNETISPKLTLLSTVPDLLTTETKVQFKLTNVDPASVEYFLVNRDTQKVFKNGKPNHLLDSKYALVISPENFPFGHYALRVRYIPKTTDGTNSLTKQTKNIAYFSVPEKEPVAEDPVVSNETELIDESKTTEPVVEQEKQNETDGIPKFSLYTKETTVAGMLVINVVQTSDLRDLELYARPVTSLISRFLGKATERSGAKAFYVNTESFLPNGKYEFYARGLDMSGKVLTTPSILITVKNISEPAVSVISEESVQKERDFAPINIVTQKEDLSATSDIKTASEDLVTQESKMITELLRNYASARQSGDEILIAAARKALLNKKDELANIALMDKELAGISDEVILSISEKFTDLQNRVDTFEQIRREKSGGQSAIDTDGDGISDYDELNLYKTDPNNPDTDGDGFMDGVEIIRGFNPLDDTAEAVIKYESPKNSLALVREDELIVREVIPTVNSAVAAEKPTVMAEIRGRGLPNSFVTLYIFSSPTIVTVKTDADGSFVYTLDKELEDGTHDIFVALTDNTGAIVAQSNPFSFIKQAQAFTPVDAASNADVAGDTVVQSVAKNSYNAVAGLGVLAFGLILMMLGLSLRTKDEDVVLASGHITSDKLSLGGARESSNANVLS